MASSSKKRSKAGSTPPQHADDFRLITGIGPAIELRLHGAGILTYDQLAKTPVERLATVVAGVGGASAERIRRQKWRDHAKELAGQIAPEASAAKPVAEPAAVEPAAPEPSTVDLSSGNGQHYATFKIELLLDESNEVRRTRVNHVQSGREGTWAGWQGARLTAFMVDNADLRLPRADAPLPTARPPAPRPATPPPVAPVIPTAIRTEPTMTLREIELVPAHAARAANILRQHEPFEIRLKVDVSGAGAPREPVDYSATVYARNLGSGESRIIGQKKGAISLADSLAIDVPGLATTPGAYRLQAEMTMALPSRGQSEIKVVEGGQLFQVF